MPVKIGTVENSDGSQVPLFNLREEHVTGPEALAMCMALKAAISSGEEASILARGAAARLEQQKTGNEQRVAETALRVAVHPGQNR